MTTTRKAVEQVTVGEVLELEIVMLGRGGAVETVAGAFAVLASGPIGSRSWTVTVATPRGPLHEVWREGHAVTVRT